MRWFLGVIILIHLPFEFTTIEYDSNTLTQLQSQVLYKWFSYLYPLGFRRQVPEDPNLAANMSHDQSAEQEWMQQQKNLSIQIATVRPDAFFDQYWNDTEIQYQFIMKCQKLFCLSEDFDSRLGPVCAIGAYLQPKQVSKQEQGKYYYQQFTNMCHLKIKNQCNAPNDDVIHNYVPLYRGPCRDSDDDDNLIAVTGGAQRVSRAKAFLARVTDFPEDLAEIMDTAKKTKLWKGN